MYIHIQQYIHKNDLNLCLTSYNYTKVIDELEKKIRSLKKGLKGMNLSSLSINSAVYINNSLCTYYKMLWGKCRDTFVTQIYSLFLGDKWYNQIKNR